MVNLKDVVKFVNQMVQDGIIKSYAIGGAVGATFYLEPVATLNIDVFIPGQIEESSLKIDLSFLFNYLSSKGYQPRGEYVIISGTPVQFLHPVSALVEEAIEVGV